MAISSVYQGIAKASFDYVLESMKSKKDVYSQTSMAFMPGPQYALGELKIHVETAWSQLLTFARQADQE
ncbi:hypothetical protein GK047_22145 [Paenibacillus sp. SYP-B3998]|uniref:Acyl-CoA dehydrogenase C-terminal domain-containing protein n=1 Tax=Paenibacillus sp. SYP-B3998 TaxID=2678564 RepID=A0A6G4A4F7_9BACL|nr:hypothetical protein [Paenibacillus sp. SYP-B3998]